MKVRGAALALFVGVELGFLAACATNQSTAAQVRLTDDPDAVKGCHFLGQVKGSDPAWSTNAQGLSQAQSEIKSQASQLGADTVFIASTLGAGGTYGGTSMVGDAYKCGRAAAAPPAKQTTEANHP